MPESNVDEEAQAAQAEAIAKDGRWLATEDGDNAVFASEEAYVGAEPERMNHAYDETKPLEGEPEGDEGKAEKAIFDRLKSETADLQGRNMNVTRMGTIGNTAVHPSEREQRPGVRLPEGYGEKAEAEARESKGQIATEDQAPDADAPSAAQAPPSRGGRSKSQETAQVEDKPVLPPN
jgi:hypothetical protein